MGGPALSSIAPPTRRASDLLLLDPSLRVSLLFLVVFLEHPYFDTGTHLYDALSQSELTGDPAAWRTPLDRLY